MPTAMNIYDVIIKIGDKMLAQLLPSGLVNFNKKNPTIKPMILNEIIILPFLLKEDSCCGKICFSNFTFDFLLVFLLLILSNDIWYFITFNLFF